MLFRRKPYRRKGNHLCQHFGRFNFFDSDAAYKLSAGKSSEEIQAAIHSLFLGEQANTLEIRMQACETQLSAKERSLHKDIEKARATIAELNTDLEALAAIKDTRDALLRELRAKAKTNGWKHLPKRFDEEELLTLQGDVDDLRSKVVDYTRQFHWFAEVSVTSLQREEGSVSDYIDKMRSQRDSAGGMTVALEKSKAKLAAYELELKAIAKVLAYHDEPDAFSLRGLTSSIQAAEHRLETLREASRLVDGIDMKVFEEASATPDVFSGELNEELKTQREIIARGKRRIAEFEARVGNVKSLIIQIKSIGQHYCLRGQRFRSR